LIVYIHLLIGAYTWSYHVISKCQGPLLSGLVLAGVIWHVSWRGCASYWAGEVDGRATAE